MADFPDARALTLGEFSVGWSLADSSGSKGDVSLTSNISSYCVVHACPGAETTNYVRNINCQIPIQYCIRSRSVFQ